MPNISSNEKRVNSNLKSYENNRRQKSSLRTSLRRFYEAVGREDTDEAQRLFNHVNSALDRAVFSKIHHKNYARRKKAELARVMNQINA